MANIRVAVLLSALALHEVINNVVVALTLVHNRYLLHWQEKDHLQRLPYSA